ncbi:conserved hypothetical protein [Ricinus communis]|uniref:Uncharacterized protein n=1 Tax=Ricinus communis TaxID=3988 RepID=B9T2G1_RICCO|nr:conserved hypothetical protein [Ricinus communis]
MKHYFQLRSRRRKGAGEANYSTLQCSSCSVVYSSVDSFVRKTRALELIGTEP